MPRYFIATFHYRLQFIFIQFILSTGSVSSTFDHLVFRALSFCSDSLTKISGVMTPGEGLTAEQIAIFERDGYLIIPNALPEETVLQLLKETHSLLDDFSLEDHPMTKFSTGENSEHVGDDYFLSSGDKIRFFFEEGMT